MGQRRGHDRALHRSQLLALPLLLHQPKSFLAICFGMGTTSCAQPAGIPACRWKAVELVPQVYDCFPMFPDAGHPGRPGSGCTRTTAATQPSGPPLGRDHPGPAAAAWSAGCVNSLLSREFFRLCKGAAERGHHVPVGDAMAWPMDGWSWPPSGCSRTSGSTGSPRYPGLYLVGTRSGKPLDTHRFEALARTRPGRRPERNYDHRSPILPPFQASPCSAPGRWRP